MTNNFLKKAFDFACRRILPILLGIMFVLFFVGGPDYHSPRHFKTVWNLGHILFFSLLPYYVFTQLKWLQGRFGRQRLMTMAVAIVIGILIEFVQHNFHRTPDAGDVFRDIIGGMVALFFLLPGRKHIRKKLLRLFQVATFCLVAVQAYPVIVAVSDELVAWDQFPVLSDFETPWEIQRWHGNADISIDNSINLNGMHSLKVQLKTTRYSGVYLFYFPRNWAKAKSFQFSICNPSDRVIRMTCRINDGEHDRRSNRYEDRFNRQFRFSKGWTTITIPISDIENAPKGRKMDLKDITGVGFFVSKLTQPRVVYIDDVKLEE